MGNANYGINTDDRRIKELEGITVGKALELIGKNIKIGTKNGGGYFFCGDKEEFIYNLKDIERSRKSRLVTAHRKAEANAKAACKAPKAGVEDYLTSLFAKNSIENIEPTYDGYVEFVKERMEEVKKKARYVTKKREQSEAYKTLRKHEVVEAYASISEPDTTILLIKGNEAGWYWTTDECTDEI